MEAYSVHSNTGLPHNPRAGGCRRHNGIGTKQNRCEKHRSDIGEVEDGAADGNRTHDLRLTKASLYPLATAAVVIQRNCTSFIKVWFQTSDPTPVNACTLDMPFLRRETRTLFAKPRRGSHDPAIRPYGRDSVVMQAGCDDEESGRSPKKTARGNKIQETRPRKKDSDQTSRPSSVWITPCRRRQGRLRGTSGGTWVLSSSTLRGGA